MEQQIIVNLETLIVAAIFVLIFAVFISLILVCLSGPTFKAKPAALKVLFTSLSLIVILTTAALKI